MTWIEKLKAKLKEKGLPEYLSGLFKGSTDEDISKIIDGFGDVKADAPEFENTLNSVVQKNMESSIDSRVNKAVNTHEAKLKEKFNFIEKKSDDPVQTSVPEPSGEIAVLKKMIEDQGRIILGISEKTKKDQLIVSFLLKAEEKKLPDSWAKRYTHMINNSEDVETLLGTAEKEFTETKQFIINEHFDGTPPPARGGAPTNDSVIKDYVESKNKNVTSGVIKGKEL